MKIPVLQEDIDRGKPKDPLSCPVYFALLRQFPDCDPIVGKYYILLGNDPVHHCPIRYGTMNKEYKFIRRFDKGKPVQPFEFNLPLDAKVHHKKRMTLLDMYHSAKRR